MDGDLLVWNAIAPLGPLHLTSYVSSLSPSQLQTYVSKFQPVIVNVKGGSHWVLVTGYDTDFSTTFYVNDPFYNLESYDFSGMLRFAIYSTSSKDSTVAQEEVQPPLKESAIH